MKGLAAVLLAAGESRRFGPASKLLADVRGEALVRRAARIAIESGVGEAVIVTGRDAAACTAAVAGLPVRCVENTVWTEGMGGSIAAGVMALSGRPIDGAFIVPADMALLQPGILRRLGSAFAAAGRAKIVVPVTAAGAQRNPVLWPSRFFDKLRGLSGPAGAKALLADADSDVERVTITDERVFTDIDTPADLDQVRAILNSAIPVRG